MPAQQVQVTVGPVDAAIALAWLAHWRGILAAIHAHLDGLSIDVTAAQVEELDALLASWERVAGASTTFWFRVATTDDEIRPVVDAWLAVGELTEDDFALLGTDWAPESMRPMTDAVIDGVTAALVALGQRAADLRDQIESPPRFG